MKKIYLGLIIFLLTPKVIFASDFLVSGEATYEIGENADANVTQSITITNAKTEVQATDFTLSLKGADIKDVRAYSDEEEYKIEFIKGETTQIKVFFDEPVLGEGNSRSFVIKYSDASVVERSGDVLEVSVPKLSMESFNSYLVRLKVPASLGKASYVSPLPDNQLETAGFITYYFNETDVGKAGVSAAFGKFQVFSFDLTYHLQNPLAFPTKIEVAIPPDSSFQKVYYDSLSPRPDNIFADSDGNWIAVYGLAARERLDVRAIGSAQIFAVPWKKSAPLSHDNLSASRYWQTEDPEIKKIAQELGTPQAIYDYVTSTLTYSYERINERYQRLGALTSLKNPKDAICTEFTDLFITLARAAGVPAREVNGFAYTDNSTLRPLSLVADVLHAWPEYYDRERELWIPVDPTWGNTTGGVDYFSKLDMRHVSFVFHGTDPENPIPPGSYKLGANPQKDVFISFGNLPSETSKSASITITQRTSLPFQGVLLVANIENPGPTALYDQKVELLFDKNKKYEQIIALLPFEKKTLEFTVPYGFFGNSMPLGAELYVGDARAEFKTNKNRAQLRDAIAFLLAGIFITSGIFIYVRRRK